MSAVAGLISVVIPTRHRPEWVIRSVESALAQSYSQLEVIVVIDGPDPASENILRSIQDKRLRVLTLEEHAGGAEARNTGVRMAHGEWIAFLDDDDTWFPKKLARQLKWAKEMKTRYPVVSSRLFLQCEEKEERLPRRVYIEGEEVSEYLFCRCGFTYGDGLLQTSTLLAKRALLLELPFLKGLKQHQDWDWILKAAQHPDVRISMLPEAMVAMRSSAPRSVSQHADWQGSLAWARSARAQMTPKAYAYFVTTECLPRARGQGALASEVWRLLEECFQYGQVSIWQLLLFFLFTFVPKKMRSALSNRNVRAICAAGNGVQ